MVAPIAAALAPMLMGGVGQAGGSNPMSGIAQMSQGMAGPLMSMSMGGMGRMF